MFARWQTAALKAVALALGCLFEKWPWPWGACWGRCLEGLEGFGGLALKGNRKPLLWPWPWGAWLRSGLGPGVPVSWGMCLEGLEGLEGFGLEGFGGFGRFGGFWRVFGGLGRFWSVWMVLERLECLRAGKRQL